MEDDISTTWSVNYESKKHAMDSKNSGSFSIRIREIERTIVQSPTGRDTLAGQKENKDASIGFVSKIPHAFLADEETCGRYVAAVLNKARVNSRIQHHIIPKICKDVINTSRGLGEEGKRGFLVEAEVQVVKETLFDKWLSASDYDSKGRLIPMEQECKICLEELSSDHGQRKVMKLPCSHNFHKDCILPWLHRKHSCPSCRDDIQDPRPRKNDGVHLCPLKENPQPKKQFKLGEMER